ncbi:uncharacterized protein LOC142776812 [Rhipicephalus microplus]|uniref:uncharacterized protein LOC142776812 n=1 Tax=Rhipicephalus microplus TaxID=6941 RepID=UPI003F6CE59B
MNLDEYVDLGSGDDIPHMAKIKLLPSSRTPLGGSSASTCEVEYPEEQVPEESSFFDLQETSGIELTELSSCADDHGSSFVLPSFGALHNIITSGETITSSLQRKIVDVLFGEMLKFTIVPTQQFYSRVALQLLEKYPNLADVMGTGYIALRKKFKNARRHMTADERLKENREKFGTNKASTRTSDDEFRKNKKAKMVRFPIRHVPFVLYS